LPSGVARHQKDFSLPSSVLSTKRTLQVECPRRAARACIAFRCRSSPKGLFVAFKCAQHQKDFACRVSEESGKSEQHLSTKRTLHVECPRRASGASKESQSVGISTGYFHVHSFAFRCRSAPKGLFVAFKCSSAPKGLACRVSEESK
jgi:hypothetical protein